MKWAVPWIKISREVKGHRQAHDELSLFVNVNAQLRRQPQQKVAMTLLPHCARAILQRCIWRWGLRLMAVSGLIWMGISFLTIITIIIFTIIPSFLRPVWWK